MCCDRVFKQQFEYGCAYPTNSALLKTPLKERKIHMSYTLVRFKCEDERLRSHLTNYFSALTKDPSDEGIMNFFKDISTLIGGMETLVKYDIPDEYLRELKYVDNDDHTMTVTLRFAYDEMCGASIDRIKNMLLDTGVNSAGSIIIHSEAD
jgi:hypothetical protein